MQSQAEVATTARGREIRVRLTNPSRALAFQLHAAARTASGDLIAPVLWSDNWIELTPAESTTLTELLPKNAPEDTVVLVEGWKVKAATLHPTVAVASNWKER